MSESEEKNTQEKAAVEEPVVEDVVEDTVDDTAQTESQDAVQTDANAAEAKVQEFQEKFMRLQADFSNYKKRSSAERLQVAAAIKGELISTLLPVMDNFERALNVPQEEQSEEVRPFIEGYEMIYKQLAGVLEKAGVRKIEALDKPFDPNYHQAVMRVPAEGVANDTIVEVLQDGYLLGDKTLRPAMVKVAFNG